jgi:thiol:disulfide interchange protein/DsbC/DsbD-like thiol-disulfide interchange protein
MIKIKYITLVLLLFAPYVHAQHVKASLIAPVQSITPASELTVGLLLDHDPHWHTYWEHPATGLPTKIEWQLPQGFTAGPIHWPAPMKFEAAGAVGFGYEDKVILITKIKTPSTIKPGDEITISAKVNWLECEVSCIPVEATVAIILPVALQTEPSKNAALIEEFQKKVPQPFAKDSPIKVDISNVAIPKAEEDPFKITVVLTGDDLDLSRASEFILFYNPDESLDLEKVSDASVDGDSAVFKITGSLFEEPPSGSAAIKSVIAYALKDQSALAHNSVTINVMGAKTIMAQKSTTTTAPPPSKTGLSQFLLMILFAFIGGLILNIMPCVLPVISLKVFSFVKQANESRKRIFLLGMVYCLGVIASFWVLAGVVLLLQAQGKSAGLNTLFQYPTFVIAITAVIFALGLNMVGVFEISAPGGAGVQGLAKMQEKEGPTGAFFTGVLATILATPCSAPFLGTAVAFAVTQPPIAIIGMFTAIGVGLAFPFLILSIFPGWTRFIPKPGNWMIIFKQVMGFLLLGTVVWLLYIANRLMEDGAVWTLAFLTCLGVGCWMIGAFIDYGSSKTRRRVVWLMTAGIAAFGYFYFVHPRLSAEPVDSSEAVVWVDYSKAELDKLRAEGSIVFVDATADWCLTCKWNERRVLAAQEVEKVFLEKKVVAMKADYTRSDPEVAKLLKEFNRPSVPMYVVYPPGDKEPILLPEVITKEMVLDSLEEANF